MPHPPECQGPDCAFSKEPHFPGCGVLPMVPAASDDPWVCEDGCPHNYRPFTFNSALVSITRRSESWTHRAGTPSPEWIIALVGYGAQRVDCCLLGNNRVVYTYFARGMATARLRWAHAAIEALRVAAYWQETGEMPDGTV